jgi:hypothetical protein
MLDPQGACSMDQKRLLTVTRLVDEGDRVLLYGSTPTARDYHVIASPGCPAQVGDRISYTPHGRNYGWFVAVEGPATPPSAGEAHSRSDGRGHG